MADSSSVVIRVPASTANLGPGFDCLGLALDIWNETSFTLSGDSISIEITGEGQNQLARNESNLIYRSFYETLEKHAHPVPSGIKISCKNEIPVSSGLGSSATAVITGIYAANSLFNLNLSKVDIFNLAVKYEGHGDNLAASLEGGLVLVFPTESGFHFTKIEAPSMHIVICVPEIQLSTHEARNSLPKTYESSDVVFNISHTVLLVHAFRKRNYSLLKTAMQDRIHQPYRFMLIPGAEKAIYAAYDRGASGVALSGAGPGLIAFCKKSDPSIAKAMQTAFQKEEIRSKTIITETCLKSAHVLID
jgi:homoserine kinase